jgi:hypothetical protein
MQGICSKIIATMTIAHIASKNAVYPTTTKPKPPFGEVVERIATYHLTMASYKGGKHHEKDDNRR